MNNTLVRFYYRSFILVFFMGLSACNGFFDKDNSPTPATLTPLRAEVQPHKLWVAQTGSAQSDASLRLTPAIHGDVIYVSNTAGRVFALNRFSGKSLWFANTQTPLTTGPGVGNDIVVVGAQRGKLIALEAQGGRLLWERQIHGEILANPAVSQGVVVAKTVDGIVRGFRVRDGHPLWSYQLSEPNLILRAASGPVITGNATVVGFANGKLAKFNLQRGQQEWIQTIGTPKGAFAIERMTDLDANPVIRNNNIYAATYQGQIAALDNASGSKYWHRDLSSYTGMAVDNQAVYVSDAMGHLWSFNARNGDVIWRQNQLNARGITGPAQIGNYLVVGDAEGYLHWINASNGRLAAREYIGPSITASPLAKDGIVYAYANNGHLVAYSLS